jgi:hypothetical protein
VKFYTGISFGARALRVSPKKEKPSPRIVYRYGKQDREIRKYLECLKTVKGIISKMKIRTR